LEEGDSEGNERCLSKHSPPLKKRLLLLYQFLRLKKIKKNSFNEKINISENYPIPPGNLRNSSIFFRIKKIVAKTIK